MANTYLTRSQTNGNQDKWTFSGWIKRSKLGAAQCIFATSNGSTTSFDAKFDSSDRLRVYNYFGGGFDADLVTTRVFRDTNAWYHIVIVYDSGNSTEAHRLRIYVNGTEESSFSTTDYPGINANSDLNVSGSNLDIGRQQGGSQFFHGAMSHLHFSDGYAYAPTVFGTTDSTTGEWKILTGPSFTPGTNGFTILKDGNTITDQSANSNNFSLGGGTLTKTEDCPSNVFCTFNYIFGAGNQSSINSVGGAGGTQFSSGSTSNECFVVGNLAFSSGKYYWEWKAISEHPEANFWGVADIDQINSIGNGSIQLNGKSYVWAGSQGNKFNGSNDGSYGSQIDINNIGMVAVDMDNNKIWLGENGTWFASGNPATGANAMYSNLSGTVTPFHCDDYSTYTPTAYYNFGNGYFGTTAVSSAGTNASGIGIFEYDVPAGFTALCTKGLNE